MLRFGRCIKYFNRNGLTFHKKGTFSETIDSTKQKTSQVAPEFNSYKDLPQIVRESQSNSEKETNWRRLEDKDVLKTRKQIREKRKENLMAVYLTVLYLIFEEQFGSVRGFVIGPFDFSFFSKFFKKEEYESVSTIPQPSS